MQTPDSTTSPGVIEAPVDGAQTCRSTSELVAAMSAAVAGGDAPTASLLLQEAIAKHPGDPVLAPAICQCKALIRRADWLEAALDAMAEDLKKDQFSAAIGHFREALGLSRGLPLLKARTDRQAEIQAAKLLPQNWRVAEAILQEAAAVEPFFRLDATLPESLQRARYDEIVARAIYQADRAEFDGKIVAARQRLVELLLAHPEDTRLSDRLYRLDHPVSHQPVATVTQAITAKTVLPKFVPDNFVREAAFKPWRTRIVVSAEAWSLIKNLIALVTTTTMLGFAGVLLWQHFGRPAVPASTMRAIQPPAPAKPTDEQAWELVKTSNDPESIREFLNTFPDSSHAFPAKVMLAAADKRAIIDSLHAYLAQQSDPTLHNSVNALGDPIIDGDQAKVGLHPKGQANAPVRTVTLLRQGNKWKVQSIR